MTKFYAALTTALTNRLTVRAWTVVDTAGLSAGDPTPVLGRFASEEAAAEFIGTLPEHETGRYGLDGPVAS